MKVVINGKQKNYFKQIGLERQLINLPEPPKQRQLSNKIILLQKQINDNMKNEQIPLTHDFLNIIENEINKKDDINKQQSMDDQDIQQFLDQLMNEKEQKKQNKNFMEDHHKNMFSNDSNEKYDEKYEDHHHSKEEEYENILNLINQSENQFQSMNLQNKKKIKEHHDHSKIKIKKQSSILSSSEIETSSEEQQHIKNDNINSIFLDHLIRDNKEDQNDIKGLLNKLNNKFDQVIQIINDIKENGINHKQQKDQNLDIHIDEINKIFENLHQDELKFQQQTGLGQREFSESEKNIIKDILSLIENLPEDIRQKIIIPKQYEQMLHESQILKDDNSQIGQHMNDFIQFIEQIQNKSKQHQDIQPFLQTNQINYDDMIPLLEKNEKFDPHYTDQNKLSLEELEQRREKLVRQYLQDHPNFQFNPNEQSKVNKQQIFQVDHQSSQEKGMIHFKTVEQPIVSRIKSNVNHMEINTPKIESVKDKFQLPQLTDQDIKDNLKHDNVEKENLVQNNLEKDNLIHDNVEKENLLANQKQNSQEENTILQNNKEVKSNQTTQKMNSVDMNKQTIKNNQQQLLDKQNISVEEQPQNETKEILVYDNVENDQSKGIQSVQNEVKEPMEMQNTSQQTNNIQSSEVQNIQNQTMQKQDKIKSQDESIDEADKELQIALKNISSEESIQENATQLANENKKQNVLPENEINQIDSNEQIEQELEKLKQNDKIETPKINPKGELTPSQEEEVLLQVAKANTDPVELKDWEDDEKQALKDDLKDDENKNRILL